MGKGGYIGGSTVIHAGSGWIGRGSVTSQPAEKPKRAPATGKANSKKKARKGSLGAPKKGNGLTIAETVAKANQKVHSIESEIGRTKQRLGALERDLTQALKEVEAAQNLPRKTALGVALQEADKSKPAVKPAKSKIKTGKLSEADRIAERLARQNYRDAPKGVVVEHRVAGKMVGNRTVERS